MRRMLSCFAAVVALGAFADDTQHATGFRPPPFAPVLRRVEPSKTRALLRSGGDALPEKWDSREKGWISSVKDQGSVGACWTFAAYAVLEAQLLKAGKGEHDFSEKNMANLHGFTLGPNVGGNTEMAAAYLLRWGGAIAESNDVYKATLDQWTKSPMLAPEVHVQNVVKLPALGSSTTAAQELKAAITNYGAVAVSICWDRSNESTNTYYYSGSVDANHAVAVIGWDDNFPCTAFWKAAPKNGAWLIKNSWGKGQGDQGYFWVSYADAKFSRDEYPTVFIPATDEEDYDIVRGYDRCGYIYDVTGWHSDYFYDLQASVFTSSKNEELAAVGLYTDVYPCPYEISVYTNVVKGAATPVEGGVLACTQSGAIDHAGFATIHLTNPIPLADTNSFAVVYRQTGEYRQTIVSCTYLDRGAYYCQPTNRPGNCYVGYVKNTGTNWMDACSEADKVAKADEGWGLCIKAYTRFVNGAPNGDAPAVDDDGTQMMGELAAKKDSYLMETSDTFGPLASLVGANGRSRWASWLLGLDPDDADKRDIALSIDLSAGSPRISWEPSLPGRTYTLYGRDSISPASAWYVVSTNELDTTSARFFRLSIGR